MKKSALSGAVVAVVLAIGPFAPAAMASTTAPAAPGQSTYANRCHETHFYDGRWHRRSHLICSHRGSNDDRRFGGNHGHDGGDHDGHEHMLPRP